LGNFSWVAHHTFSRGGMKEKKAEEKKIDPEKKGRKGFKIAPKIPLATGKKNGGADKKTI